MSSQDDVVAGINSFPISEHYVRKATSCNLHNCGIVVDLLWSGTIVRGLGRVGLCFAGDVDSNVLSILSEPRFSGGDYVVSSHNLTVGGRDESYPKFGTVVRSNEYDRPAIDPIDFLPAREF